MTRRNTLKLDSRLFCTNEEIRPLHEEAGFQTIALAGSNQQFPLNDDSYNRLEGTVRQGWLDLLFRISTEQV